MSSSYIFLCNIDFAIILRPDKDKVVIRIAVSFLSVHASSIGVSKARILWMYSPKDSAQMVQCNIS